MTCGENQLKSILSGLAVVAASCLLMAQAGCTQNNGDTATENAALDAPVPAGMIRGPVLETMDSAGYTYVRVQTGGDSIWAAGPQTVVAAGDVVQIARGMPMQQFQSKTLDRTFDVVYFVPAIENLTAPGAAAPAPAQTRQDSPPVTDVSVAELEPGKNIAWVHANRETLANEPISLRGKVVKYNSNILGWNFIHIQDGSGNPADGSNDLAVTSKATTAVGETVVIAGTVTLDKDFSAGYVFPILIEDATLTAE